MRKSSPVLPVAKLRQDREEAKRLLRPQGPAAARTPPQPHIPGMVSLAVLGYRIYRPGT